MAKVKIYDDNEALLGFGELNNGGGGGGDVRVIHAYSYVFTDNNQFIFEPTEAIPNVSSIVEAMENGALAMLHFIPDENSHFVYPITAKHDGSDIRAYITDPTLNNGEFVRITDGSTKGGEGVKLGKG